MFTAPPHYQPHRYLARAGTARAPARGRRAARRQPSVCNHPAPDLRRSPRRVGSDGGSPVKTTAIDRFTPLEELPEFLTRTSSAHT